MQSLAKRHEDRAQRKAMNRAEGRLNGGTSLSIGSVALAYRQFAMLASRLRSDGEKSELAAAIEGIDAEFAGGYRSLSEAPDGSGDTMAGIGVVNPFVVPAAVLASSDGEGKGASVANDAAWGETKPTTVAPLPEADVDTSKGNLNGLALSEQLGDAGGWGTETPTTANPAEANSGNGGGTDSGAGDNA